MTLVSIFTIFQMKKIILLLFLFCTNYIFSQNDKYNLNFESSLENESISHWHKKIKEVNFAKDSVTKFQGKYALKIAANEKDENVISGVENIIKGTFEGKEIVLQGYIKTYNVQNSYVYLIVGTEDNQYSFDMSPTISGTKDWQKFEIKIPYTSESTKLTIACNLEGPGQVWIDAFNLKIDGIDINELQPTEEIKAFDYGFTMEEPSKSDIEKLEVIGKLWGFLKYFHPNVASGNYDWDNELFQILPLIENNDFDLKIEEWVNSLGNFQLEKASDKIQDIKFSPNFDWFENQFITTNLKRKLENILKAKRLENNHYVHFSEELKIPVFDNERIYSTMQYEDYGMKLLALFRYWNYIEYFYPYKYLITSDWDHILKEYISRFYTTKNDLDYTLLLEELIAETEDTHHFIVQNKILDDYYGKFKLPLSVQFIKNKLVVINSITQNNMINPGDVILDIDGITIDSLKSKFLKYSTASNYPTTLREVAKKIIRTDKDSIPLTIQRAQKSFKIKMSTVPFYRYFKEKESNNIKEVSGDIGYLNTQYLQLEDYDSIFNRWKNKKAIIFDIRNYPKENFIRLLPYLHDKPSSFFLSTSTNLSNPGVFSFDPKIIFENKNGYQFKGKIIILVNNNSQSKAEFNALALKSYSKSIIIGNQTAGTDGDITHIVLPGNVQTEMTGVGIYKLDKSETQKVGIKPDIVINPTLKSIKNDKDVILEAAIKEAYK